MESRSTGTSARVPIAGWWGLVEFVEPRVRRVVAERLGVAESQLEASVSLFDDLAADSLDALEVALALEAELGIEITEAALANVRLYGELVGVVTGLIRTQHVVPTRFVEEPIPVQARLVPGTGVDGAIERAEWLTPYVVQTIMEDALRGGPGTRLELTLPAAADEAALATVRHQFARLGTRGLDVRIARAGTRAGRTPAAA